MPCTLYEKQQQLDLCVKKELLLKRKEKGDSSAQPRTYLLPDALKVLSLSSD